jgi:hypothetical protein
MATDFIGTSYPIPQPINASPFDMVYVTNNGTFAANAQNDVKMPAIGMYIINNKGEHSIATQGKITNPNWSYDIGMAYISFEHDGKLTQDFAGLAGSTGHIVQIAGYFISRDTLILNLDFTYVEVGDTE